VTPLVAAAADPATLPDKAAGTWSLAFLSRRPAKAGSGHLFPDAEDLGRGAIDAIFAVALTEQERNQYMW
jgi:hypothetical protein